MKRGMKCSLEEKKKYLESAETEAETEAEAEAETEAETRLFS
jgi:hypothetical protein